MSSDRSAALPASRDRPADSDGLPKCEWARTVEEGGYEPVSYTHLTLPTKA